MNTKPCTITKARPRIPRATGWLLFPYPEPIVCTHRRPPDDGIQLETTMRTLTHRITNLAKRADALIRGGRQVKH